MSDGNPELLSTSQTYNGQSENNEDYEIPPITPPNLPEPSLLHLGDHEASYHSLCHGLAPNGLLPAYSYQAMDLPAIMVSNMLAQDSHLLSGQLPTIQEMVHSEVAAYDSGRPGPLMGRPAMLASHMSALSQSQLISQMGIRSSIAHSSPSPPGSKSATPSPSSSTQEEESEAHFKMSGEKRPSADPGKKAKNPKKKKKKDPNEPQKPVSAYALFFRDTQAAIKGQNPSATFGDVSKIVASMWDSLGEEQKQAYKRKTEAAKKEYLKALAAYRASLVSKSSPDQGETKSTQVNPPAKMLPPKQPMYAMPGLASFLTPSDLQAFRSGASPASLARTLGSKSLLPGLSTSPPPPPSFPLSPPLHQQLPLTPHAQGALLSPPVSMSPAPQAPVLPTPMALQVQLAMSPSPPGPQLTVSPLLCRTSLTSLSSPAAQDPALLAHPTPRAAGTGTAVTPAGSAASALAGQSSPDMLGSCLCPTSTGRVGTGVPRRTRTQAQPFLTTSPAGERRELPRVFRRGRTVGQALDQWFSIFLMPRPFNSVPVVRTAALDAEAAWEMRLVVNFACFAPSILVFSQMLPCDIHRWVLCLRPGPLEAEPEAAG
ncbi:TOX high mobility group box family member 2 isoform X5 [Nycticebus coucang]|nr:TOX high mobility group box family member 2 isoform X5 [Nycticebus coucang]XP_053430557.1 TOX high mobility group box family member 2 isoform X5 [Nycticebus coucang]XP_053430563.1 TOX high mobility group box family member 2 isoform X5 [Nycticebus coucang]